MDLQRELRASKTKTPAHQPDSSRVISALEAELASLKQERQAQDELNVEFQRRITTLSVCLTELADINAISLQSNNNNNNCNGNGELQKRNATVQALGREATLGLVHVDDVPTLAQSVTPATPMTPLLLQDYQGELERLKFRLKTRKAKLLQTREELAAARDQEAAALQSAAKYEKHIKRKEREFEEALRKERELRKAARDKCKGLERRISELEFLLENDDSDLAGQGSD